MEKNEWMNTFNNILKSQVTHIDEPGALERLHSSLSDFSSIAQVTHDYSFKVHHKRITCQEDAVSDTDLLWLTIFTVGECKINKILPYMPPSFGSSVCWH